MRHILKCNKCSKYTMKDTCCNNKASNIKPAKFNLEDNYGKYRRQAKKEILEKEGLI